MVQSVQKSAGILWYEGSHGLRIYTDLPSSRLKVEFLPTSPESSAAELTQESLYTLFRRYGKITEITPQPFDSKVVPRYGIVDYERMRFASMAKNCMHGFVVGQGEGGGKSGTILKMSYEPKFRAGKSIWEWFSQVTSSHRDSHSSLPFLLQSVWLFSTPFESSTSRCTSRKGST